MADKVTYNNTVSKSIGIILKEKNISRQIPSLISIIRVYNPYLIYCIELWGMPQIVILSIYI